MNRLKYKTTVYRAIYYSGFDWNRITSSKEVVDYKLTSKKSGFTIYLNHKSEDDNDIIYAKTGDALTDTDQERFYKLMMKIYRRTKDLKIIEDFVDVSKFTKDQGEITTDDNTNS